MRKQLYDLEVIQYCVLMKKVRCGGQPLTVDPGVDIKLVRKSTCGSLQLWIGKLCCYVNQIMSVIVQDVLAITDE